MSKSETPLDDQPSALASSTNSRVQFESERMSRRAALRKFGIGAGMAALLALSTDDLARMASLKIKQHAGDSKLANKVADDFKNAGVAFADASSPSSPSSPSGPSSDPCSPSDSCANNCNRTRAAEVKYNCGDPDPVKRDICLKAANIEWCKCIKNHNCPCKTSMPAQCSDDCTSAGC